MTEPMHDLLAAAIDRRANDPASGKAFAEGHGVRLARAIRARRVATYAGTGTALVIGAVGVVLGVQVLAWVPSTLFPASQPSPDPSMAIPSITPAATVGSTLVNLATPFATTLVEVPLDDSIWSDDGTYRLYVFYASVDPAEMIPFPASGIYYPGIPDVPSDALIVAVDGDVAGFDVSSSEADLNQIVAISASSGEQLVGSRDNYDFQWTDDGQNASIAWDVIGDVTEHTRWSVHYFVVNGEVVSEVEGRANPDAIEVTATFNPAPRR